MLEHRLDARGLASPVPSAPPNAFFVVAKTNKTNFRDPVTRIFSRWVGEEGPVDGPPWPLLEDSPMDIVGVSERDGRDEQTLLLKSSSALDVSCTFSEPDMGGSSFLPFTSDVSPCYNARVISRLRACFLFVCCIRHFERLDASRNNKPSSHLLSLSTSPISPTHPRNEYSSTTSS